MTLENTRIKKSDKYVEKNYSKLLKQVINLYNIDSFEIADEIGVSEATIRQWQTGRNFPSKSTLDNLYEFLSTKISNNNQLSLNKQLDRYISESLASVHLPTPPYYNNYSNLLVTTLKLFYTNGKTEPHEHTLTPTYLTTNKTKVVIFDFDGTLTNNNSTKTTWESIWIELGYSVEECRDLHRQFDMKKITHDEWCKLTTKKFIKKKLHVDSLYKIASDIHLIDGCKKTFDELALHNIKIFIVSGSILFIIQQVLKELYWRIDAIKANDFIFSSDGYLTEIIGSKYDFEGKSFFVREIAENLKLSTNDILFIGNSYNDKYVYTSGAKTLCINPKNTDPSDTIIWHNCIQECTDLSQILDYVIF